MTAITQIIDDNGRLQGNVLHLSASDDSSLQLNGSADAGSLVRIYSSGQLIAEVTADSSGAWTYTAAGLSDGAHYFTATSVDSMGLESPHSSQYQVNVDTIAVSASNISVENVNGNLQSGNQIADGSISLSGIAEANATVSIFDNGMLIATVQVDPQGQWKADVQLGDGYHELTSQVVDEVGNSSLETNVISLNVDTSPSQFSALAASPAAQQTAIILPPGTTIFDGGLTNDSTPLIQGTATPGAEVVLSVYNDTYGPVTADANGVWSVQIINPLPEGVATFRARASNATGDAYQGYTLTIDTEAPAAPSIDFGVDNVGLYQDDLHHPDVTDDDVIEFHGTAEAGNIVALYNGANLIGVVVADANGDWAITPTSSFVEGTHKLIAVQTDQAGNSSEASVEFEITVDRSVDAPVITHLDDDQGSIIGKVANGAVSDDQLPKVAGTAEAGALVTIFVNGNEVGTSTANDQGLWSFQLTSELSETKHEITASQLDIAGNSSGLSDSFEVEIVLNAAPDAIDDVFSLFKEEVLDVLANDSDPDGDTLSLTRILGQGNHGTASINAAGELVYTPNANISGPVDDVISYEVSDGKGGVASASVNVRVNPQLIQPTIDLIASSDSGKYNYDNITRITTPTLQGKATAGAQVDILQGNSIVASVTADANGNWSYTSSYLNDGVYNFTAQSSGFGQNATSSNLAVTIDTYISGSVSYSNQTFGHSFRYTIHANETVDYKVAAEYTHTNDGRGWVWYSGYNSAFYTSGTTNGYSSIRPWGTWDHVYLKFKYQLTDLAGNTIHGRNEVNIDPIAALEDGGYVVSYVKISELESDGFDIYARRYDAQGNQVGQEVLVNSSLANAQSNPDAAGLRDGGYVITWQSEAQDGDGFGVYAQRFDESGQKLGAEFQINVETKSNQITPIVNSLSDGGFVFVWASDLQDGSGRGVYMRLFNSEGDALSPEIQVNGQSELNQSLPIVTELSNGNLVVTWESNGAFAGDGRVYARLFSSVGEPLSAEFALAEGQAGEQLYPYVVAADDGAYSVTWVNVVAEDWANVYMQTYSADGEAIYGQPLLVNGGFSAANDRPEIAHLADGSAIVVWSAVDDSAQTIRITKISASGEILLEQSVLATANTNIQLEPHAVALNEGGFLLTWTELSHSGQQATVWGQQYDDNGNVVRSVFEVNTISTDFTSPGPTQQHSETLNSSTEETQSETPLVPILEDDDGLLPPDTEVTGDLRTLLVADAVPGEYNEFAMFEQADLVWGDMLEDLTLSLDGLAITDSFQEAVAYFDFNAPGGNLENFQAALEDDPTLLI